ncbi:MAG: hypothetical protein R3Y54_10565 [Eubacteriales bacterium]
MLIVGIILFTMDPTGNKVQCPRDAYINDYYDTAFEVAINEGKSVSEAIAVAQKNLLANTPVDMLKVFVATNAGHHVPSIKKSDGKPFTTTRYDKNRPTLFPTSSNSAHDHWRLHNAEGYFIGSRQDFFSGTSDALFDGYREAYKYLDDIKVDVKSPDGKVVLGTNVTPYDAVDLMQNWLKTQGKY